MLKIVYVCVMIFMASPLCLLVIGLYKGDYLTNQLMCVNLLTQPLWLVETLGSRKTVEQYQLGCCCQFV